MVWGQSWEEEKGGEGQVAEGWRWGSGWGECACEGKRLQAALRCCWVGGRGMQLEPSAGSQVAGSNEPPPMMRPVL